MARYIGVDIGGTKVAAVLVDSRFRVIKSFRMQTMHGRKGLLLQLESVAEALGFKGVSAIGISVAGWVRNGRVLLAPNIKGLAGLDLKGHIGRRRGKKVFVENDANCFAVAEHMFGAGKSANVVGIVLGTGIGSGIIINHKLYKPKGAAGEIGHMIIDPGGLRCGCGQRGDLESWCSGPSIVKRYKVAGGRMWNPSPQAIFSSREKLAKHIAEETVEKLSVGISNVIKILDPEIIVLGGGLSNLPFYHQLRKRVSKLTQPGYTAAILKSALGENAGAIGAAYLAATEKDRPKP